jgi:DNA-nicking Smr family endonuclease
LASKEASARSSCFDKAHKAYERGDSGAAHNLSEEGKKHGAQMEAYNKQASEFIFRENNAEGRVDSDTIDLHGQFVEEAEDILEERIRYAQSHGQTHLHVIVGKGNHSYDHVQKIKPRVEQVCQQLGLQYATEHNEGRMYINLTGGPAQMPSQYQGGGGGGQQQYHGGQQQGGYPGGQQQHYGGGQQHGQQQGQNEEVEKLVKKFLPRILRKLGCGGCTVM